VVFAPIAIAQAEATGRDVELAVLPVNLSARAAFTKDRLQGYGSDRPFHLHALPNAAPGTI